MFVAIARPFRKLSPRNYIHGGNFWTEGNAVINGDILFDAGTINLQHNNQNATATLAGGGRLPDHRHRYVDLQGGLHGG